MGDLHAVYIPEDDVPCDDGCDACEADDGEDFGPYGLWLCEDCLNDAIAEDRQDRKLHRAIDELEALLEPYR